MVKKLIHLMTNALAAWRCPSSLRRSVPKQPDCHGILGTGSGEAAAAERATGETTRAPVETETEGGDGGSGSRRACGSVRVRA